MLAKNTLLPRLAESASSRAFCSARLTDVSCWFCWSCWRKCRPSKISSASNSTVCAAAKPMMSLLCCKSKRLRSSSTRAMARLATEVSSANKGRKAWVRVSKR